MLIKLIPLAMLAFSFLFGSGPVDPSVIDSIDSQAPSFDSEVVPEVDTEDVSVESENTFEEGLEPKLEYNTISDGINIVSEDVEPGVYRTLNYSGYCYYARLSSFSGSRNILANENATGPSVVEILASDKGFESDGCGQWTSNLEQITKDKTIFGDGIYIVGTDIEPGTYRNEGVDYCYYARLSNFTGSDSILANDNVDGQAVVTIATTDVGFQSDGCGVWTKID